MLPGRLLSMEICVTHESRSGEAQLSLSFFSPRSCTINIPSPPPVCCETKRRTISLVSITTCMHFNSGSSVVPPACCNTLVLTITSCPQTACNTQTSCYVLIGAYQVVSGQLQRSIKSCPVKNTARNYCSCHSSLNVHNMQ